MLSCTCDDLCLWQLQKLKSTYVDGMASCVRKGYLSTHWDQTAAVTGRLTSFQPNIQAIPKVPVTITDVHDNFIVGEARLVYIFNFRIQLTDEPKTTIGIQ